MNADEIVKQLRSSNSWHAVYADGIMGIDDAPLVAANLIERQEKALEDEQAAKRECWKKIHMLRGVIDDVEKALIFYADPFSAVDEHGEAVRVPDFYSELSFGDIASAALATIRAARGEKEDAAR